jgi:hypothetical protein
MCLCAIYIFPGSVHIFSCSRIGRPTKTSASGIVMMLILYVMMMPNYDRRPVETTCDTFPLFHEKPHPWIPGPATGCDVANWMMFRIRASLILNLNKIATLQGKSHLCIPFLGIARPQSQFPHSCVCERFIYSQDRSTYFPAAEQADQSWKYKNLSQIYECGNWETESYNSVLEITVSILGIHKCEPEIYIGFSPALHLQCRAYLQYR